jgi:hypothetical protein
MEWLAKEGFPEQVRMANMMECFACGLLLISNVAG